MSSPHTALATEEHHASLRPSACEIEPVNVNQAPLGLIPHPFHLSHTCGDGHHERRDCHLGKNRDNRIDPDGTFPLLDVLVIEKAQH